MLKKAGIVICIAASLVACSQPKSKIESLGKEKAAQLIQDSAAYYEMLDGKSQFTMGGVYGTCMEHSYSKEMSKKDCDKLYAKMIYYIQKKPGFEKVKVSDITNESFYDYIKSFYKKDVLRSQQKAF